MTSRGSISLPRLFAAVTTLVLAWLVTPVFNSAALAAQWTTTGSMTDARSRHTATLFQNGTVLVAGGVPNLATAELYNPTAGTWSAAGSMAVARSQHTATLLPNGKVLVAGGSDPTAELYDPTANTWSATASMADARGNHTATLLQNGNVVVAGGEGGPASNFLASAELYSSQSTPVFAGTPGTKNCIGVTDSALSNQFGTLTAAANAFGESVKALQNAITAFCRG